MSVISQAHLHEIKIAYAATTKAPPPEIATSIKCNNFEMKMGFMHTEMKHIAAI